MLWVLLSLAIAVSGAKILVLVDSWDIKNTHSKYFNFLESQGNQLTFRMADSSAIKIENYGEALYQAIILAAPSAEDLGGKTTVDDLLSFFDTYEGSIIMFADTDAGLLYRKLANNFGYDLFEQGARVYNAVNDPVVKTTNVTAPAIIAAKAAKPIHLSGVPFYMKKESSLSVSTLVASSKAFVQNDLKFKDKYSDNGSEILLGAATQGRNNARFAILGSLDICKNEFYDDSAKGNKDFCQQVTDWTLKNRGVLRYSGITNYRVDEHAKPGTVEKGYLEKEYTVKDKVYYSIDIEEYDGKTKTWKPFNSDKVYMDFIMLDPKIRKYLSSKGGLYSTEFVAPDVHGVYQFKVHFNQPGYTWINTATEASVRPYRHNQYERFLTCAYPYYLSVISTIVGFLIFSFYFLYHKDT